MLFCREFENVVNRAFLVLIFLGGKLVGANFYAFCNYGLESPRLLMVEVNLLSSCVLLSYIMVIITFAPSFLSTHATHSD